MSSQEWLAITRYALGPHIILIGRESVKQRLKNSFCCQICFLPGRRTKESQGRHRGFHGTEVLKQQRRTTVSVFRWWCGPRHARPPALLSLGQEDRSSKPQPHPGPEPLSGSSQTTHTRDWQGCQSIQHHTAKQWLLSVDTATFCGFMFCTWTRISCGYLNVRSGAIRH